MEGVIHSQPTLFDRPLLGVPHVVNKVNSVFAKIGRKPIERESDPFIVKLCPKRFLREGCVAYGKFDHFVRASQVIRDRIDSVRWHHVILQPQPDQRWAAHPLREVHRIKVPQNQHEVLSGFRTLFEILVDLAP